MELVLIQQTEAQVRVLCDDHPSHTFDLRPLLLQQKGDERTLLDDPVAYGKKLYAALFPSDSPARRALADRPQRLLLVCTSDQIDAVPWEYTYGNYGKEEEQSLDFLVLKCQVLRGLLAEQRLLVPAMTSGLHVVVVPSHPLSSEVAPLDIEGEWLRLKEIVQELPYTLTLERTRPATMDRLRQLVAGQQGRVVHFMGHGGQGPRGAVLCFEQPTGELDPIDAEAFVQRLEGRVFLVTLNACVSATPGFTVFSNLARALVQRKTPYALGMRMSILDEDAFTFSETFYSELARSVPVEEALLQARLTLARRSPSRWVVGVPVLYTSLSAPVPGFVCHDGTPTIKEYLPHLDLSALPPVEGTFQGRIGELIALGTALTGRQRPRLLTIHGSGGQGKTALAMQAAECFAWAWPGGVWATSLEHLPDRSVLLTDLAHFLGIETQNISEIKQLERLVQARLKDRRTLLLLDNVEMLIEAVKSQTLLALQLVALLKQLQGASVSLLVTSREVLGWPNEHFLELDGLLPEEGAALFYQCATQRANQIDPALVRQLSLKLDGHPLGLRLLANAFANSATPLEAFIATSEEQLAHTQDIYVGADHRHFQLYACIETSVRYLEPDVKALLSGLWIFHAPFLPATAVSIFDPDASEPAASPVLDHLHALWQRSLLTQKAITTPDGTLHFYALLPIMRPYVEQQMEQVFLREDLVTRFGATYYDITSWIYLELGHGATASVLAEQSREDLEQGCAWVRGKEHGYYLCWWGWIMYWLGHSIHGLELLEQALEIAQGTDAYLQLRAMNGMALVYSRTGRLQEALQLCEQALLLKREVGDRVGEAVTLNNMALVYRDIGKPQEALQLWEQALLIQRDAGDHTGEVAILGNMAEIYSLTGKPQEALRLYVQTLSLTRVVGNRADEAITLGNMAGVYRDTGKSQEALQLYEQALSLTREVGDRVSEAATLNNMAQVYSRIGRLQEALQLYEQSLPLMREVADRAGEAATLGNIAKVYHSVGKLQESLRLYEQVLPLMREVGNRIDETAVLSGLASLYQSLQRYPDALAAFEQSLALAREISYLPAEIAGLVGLARLLYQHSNRTDVAIMHLEHALHLLQMTGLPQDAYGNTPQQLQLLLETMRRGISFGEIDRPSTLPEKVLQQIIDATIAVMTTAQEHRSAWQAQITQSLQFAQQEGPDWQIEVDLNTALLSILDGASPALPSNHPYAPAISAILNGLAAGAPERSASSQQDEKPET